MSGAPFIAAPLDDTHDRTSFRSGSDPLDRYLREQVTQDIRRRVTTCFVALAAGQRIAGYYTLASASLLLAELPDTKRKKLPRYPTVPTVRMGRLAVDQAFKGQGLGSALLADALSRVANSQIAAYALIVDAKDEQAASFYRHHGFTPLPKSPLLLFLPLATALASKNMTKPLHPAPAEPFFITEEIEAELITAGYEFEPPDHARTTSLPEILAGLTDDELATWSGKLADEERARRLSLK